MSSNGSPYTKSPPDPPRWAMTAIGLVLMALGVAVAVFLGGMVAHLFHDLAIEGWNAWR